MRDRKKIQPGSMTESDWQEWVGRGQCKQCWLERPEKGLWGDGFDLLPECQENQE
jgi:hypothetical protein